MQVLDDVPSVLADLVVRLTELRMSFYPHLSVENFAPRLLWQLRHVLEGAEPWPRKGPVSGRARRTGR